MRGQNCQNSPKPAEAGHNPLLNLTNGTKTSPFSLPGTLLGRRPLTLEDPARSAHPATQAVYIQPGTHPGVHVRGMYGRMYTYQEYREGI